jgi:fatty acid desaturase
VTQDPALEDLQRRDLCHQDGRSFADFRRTLTPRYVIVWRDIAIAYLVIAAVAFGAVASQGHVPLYVSIPLAGIAIGYVIAYIQLFFHEAAHYNLAPTRAVNDRLANIVVGLPVGLAITDYRPIHFDHHRFLGETNDTERSYFDPLNMRFLLEVAFGVKTVRVLRLRRAALKEKFDAGDTAKPESRAGWLMLLGGVTLNCVLLAAYALLGWWALFGAWALAMLVAYPAFGALRQLLEHRDADADPLTNYAAVPHGPVTRMFTGPLDPTFGGAGFDRHLLHHWDPQLSYTRLRELEKFLEGTPAAGALASSRSTYRRTFARLFDL